MVVPTVDPAYLTPRAETLQVVIWQGIISHSKLANQRNKTEKVTGVVKDGSS